MMEFRLLYRGSLKASGTDKSVKHEIRRRFHPQLKALWDQEPLKRLLLRPQEQAFSFLPEEKFKEFQVADFSMPVANFRFLPLVRRNLLLTAKLDILLLRPEPPGAIVLPGGDIDNRLKTLFDALRMPKDSNELPGRAAPEADEKPFYCLLEDDSLIRGVSVNTDRLLDFSGGDLSEVSLVIKVQVRATKLTWLNMELVA